MIDSNCNKYVLDLVHNRKVTITNQDSFVFSSIYQKIIDISRNAPVYLIYPTEEIHQFATQIKDLSIQLSDFLKKFYEDGMENPFHQLRLDAPHSNYMGIRMLAQPQEPLTYDIQINSVAKGQKNQSKFVRKSVCPFTAQTYAFSIYSEGLSLDFEVPVDNTSSNEAILQKIASLINHTTEKIEAVILEQDSRIALSIQANANKKDMPATFTIKDMTGNGLISHYHLDNVENEPSPSYFSVNGERVYSFGTAFIIDDLFEITLIEPSDELFHLSFTIDEEIIKKEIQELQLLINHLLLLAESCQKHTLERELKEILLSHKKDLEDVGIELDDSCFLTTDDKRLENSIQDRSLEEFFSEEETFSPQLIEHTKEVSIDPLKYVPNKIVSYKDNTKINYPNPYLTSMYSGFIFTSCC